MSATRETIEACCAVLYGDPLIELLAGDSLHPGGPSTSRRLLTSARLSPGQPILDAGCGLGATARLAALEFGLAVHACDVSGAAIRRARTLAVNIGAAVRFWEASILDLPYADASFAAVIAECVLSTTSRAKALRELRRVTGRQGRLLISDVTAAEPVALPEPLATVLCLARAWQPGELEDELTSAGFVLERTWDETPVVSDLIDRLEARASLLRAVIRDAGTVDGVARTLTDRLPQLAAARSLTNLFTETRRLVRDGQIGYVALVARAG